MSGFAQSIREASDMSLAGVSDGIVVAMAIVVGLIAIASVVALVFRSALRSPT